jgi:hypothetical protein
MYHIETKSGSKINTKGVLKRPGWIPGQLWKQRGEGAGEGRDGGKQGINLCFLRKAALTEREGENP